jgi:Domain of unknown function (DUF4184)
MPLTFPAHAAIVLPAKWARPSWFDGLALVIGSSAPDFAYALDGSVLDWPDRTLPPTWYIAHSWPGIALWCLPITMAICWLLRCAAAVRWPAWYISVISAAIGAASHIVWDRLATAPIADLGSSLIGSIVTIVVLALNPHWLPRLTRRARFWWPFGIIMVAGIAVLPFLDGSRLAHTTVPRLMLIIFAAYAVAAVAARRRPVTDGADRHPEAA